MSDTPRLENKTMLCDWMAAGVKPRDAWRIGTEHEKFGYRRADLTPLPYEGKDGIRALLEGLMQFGWQGQYEDDKLIALTRPREKGGGSVTLEPGGQLELSGAPLETIHQTCAEVNGHLHEVRTVAETLGQGYLGIGFSPLWDLLAAQHMPKARYALMRDYMPTRGQRGLEMMHLSATVQVNLDFASEADMAEKLRIALSLQPLATALFANSPFKGGALSGHQSERSLVWIDTDPDRTGMLDLAFADGFGFEQYVDYALDVPMYFVIRDKQYINAMGQSFRDFLQGRLPALPNEKPTARDWEDHLTTIFTEARVKQFIEMRGADSGPWDSLCALPAFWVGLIYDAQTQRALADMIADWTREERHALRHAAPVTGLATPFRGGTLLDVAREVLALSTDGLKRRDKQDGMGNDEQHYLAPLHKVVAAGESPAAALIRAFENEWGGDVRPIFEKMSF